MYNSVAAAERINDILKTRGLQQKNMLNDCELNKNVISTMLSRNSMPKADNLAKIADYLNISVDYILGRTQNPEINKAPVPIQEPKNIITIPFSVSKVSAGKGAYISDDYPEDIDIDANTYPKADFAVEITGDSMMPKYESGDIVLVHKQPALENGQIGIFMINGEGYIKKYHYEGGKYMLMSLNNAYAPIELASNDDFQIVGRVLYTL